MIKSKIHPFSIVGALTLLGLSIFPLKFAIQFFQTFLEEGANLFFVLMAFFGLFGLAFLLISFKKVKSVIYKENVINVKFLGFFKTQELNIKNGGRFFYKNKKYGFVNMKWLNIEDNNGHQIRFSNLEVRNFEDLKTGITEGLSEETFKIKNSILDKVLIVGFLSITVWMIVSAFLGIIW